MCDFKPGDEVVCVDASPKYAEGIRMPGGGVSNGTCGGIVLGEIYYR